MRKTCSNCRYWSEMIAKTDDDFNMTAFCINRNNGPKRGTYTRETETCEAWQSGHYGAVDDPHRTDEYVAGDEGGETA